MCTFRSIVSNALVYSQASAMSIRPLMTGKVHGLAPGESGVRRGSSLVSKGPKSYVSRRLVQRRIIIIIGIFIL